MRFKNLLHFVQVLLLLVAFTSFSQVTNSISELKVNNTAVTQINFAGVATVNVTFKVKLKTFNGNSDNIFGNLFIYIKKASSTSEIQTGFSAVTFTRTDPPFVTQTTYDNETLFTIDLSVFDFNATGGMLYAEYKNNNGQKYKSEIINVVNNPNTTIPVTNSYFNLESIRYADTGNKVEDQQVLIHNGSSNISLNISYAYWKSTGATLCGDKFTYVRDKFDGRYVDVLNNGTIQTFPSAPCNLTIDTIRGTMPTFNIPVSQVNDKQHMNIFYTPKNQPLGMGGVIGAKLIFRIVNFTNPNIYAMMSSRDDNAFVIGLGGNNVKIDLSETIGQDYKTIKATLNDIEKYEWYSRPLNGMWSITQNPDYEFLKTVMVTTQFFRRAVYKGVYKDSNILTFEPYPPITPDLPEIEINNSICCDQTVAIGSPVAAVVGNTIFLRSPDKYQWQSSRDSMSWINIVDATSKDITPGIFTSSRSNVIYFRRAVILSSGTNYSNYVAIRPDLPSRNRNSSNDNNFEYAEINLYPNPTTDILNIESTDDLSAFIMNVYDSYGNKKNISQPIYDGNRINLDTINLPHGLYLLVLENEQQIIKKQFVRK